MPEEYELEYKEFDAKAFVARLADVKWGLVAMAACCFFMAFYVFVTPPQGGRGLFLITPLGGAEGLLSAVPWCAIVMGLAVFFGSIASRSPRTLGWAEPALGVAMLLAGLWALNFPVSLPAFAVTYGAMGIVAAFYLLLVALDMYVREAGQWLAVLAVAGATWVLAFMSMLGVAGLGGQLGVVALMLFVAAWGFVYGALELTQKPAEA